MTSLLVRGGTVIDGTGKAGYRADVRLQGGLIKEVGPNLRPDSERVIDASGAYVTPGLIDCHTHYDGPMWWNQRLDPLPAYGSTSAVMGNCGFSAAPMSPDMMARKDMIGIFSFIEDIPQLTFENDVPWSWHSWPEYRIALDKFPVTANIGALLGHINLRIYVMGEAAWMRAANTEERGRMAKVLDDALRAGAMGLSSNFFDCDRNGRPVPTQLADDAEFEALLDVMARYKGVIMQFALNVFTDKTLGVPQLERMVRLCQPRGIRMQYLMVPLEKEYITFRGQLLEAQHRLRAGGADLWPIFLARPITVSMSFNLSFIFRYQNVPAWDELVNHTPAENKLTKLQDPEWRARARHDVDTVSYVGGSLRNPETLDLNQSENEVGPLNITLADYAKQTGLHPSDALADWVVKNGLGSSVAMKPLKIDEDAMIEMVRYPFSVSGANDAGAHGQLFCGAAESAYILTDFVRNTGRLTLEETIHALTGKVADHFSFTDRGVIAPGMAADIAVFSLDDLEFRPEKKVRDVPDGMGSMTWRYTRAPGPFRATIVNGMTTFEADKGYTGAMPGKVIGPNRPAIACAAE